MIVFCTYFDHRYLDKGLALLRSIARNADARYAVRVLCLDEESLRALEVLDLPQVELHRLEDLERSDPELRAVKPSRSLVEYYWTLTPCWVLACMAGLPASALLIYLDADMFFFGRISHTSEAMAGASVGVVPHDYGPTYRTLHAAGRYNVGIVPFRAVPDARACVEWWRGRCLEWCYQRFEDGKFGDQAYLDEWPHRFSGVRELNTFTLKLAPWNLDRAALAQSQPGDLKADGASVACFHFHAVRRWRGSLFQLAPENIRISNVARDAIYRPYIQALASAERELATLVRVGRRPAHIPWREIVGNLVRGRLHRNLMSAARC